MRKTELSKGKDKGLFRKNSPFRYILHRLGGNVSQEFGGEFFLHPPQEPPQLPL